jgi:hypothetical protein
VFTLIVGDSRAQSSLSSGVQRLSIKCLIVDIQNNQPEVPFAWPRLFITDALAEIDIIPAEIAGLGHSEAVPVDQEADQPVAVAMPIALERRQEFVDFGLGQVLANP